MKKLKTRILSICIDPVDQTILAGDHRGVLYRLSPNLEIIDRSSKAMHASGLHIITANEEFVYSRDATGNLLRWDRKTLQLTDFLVGEKFTDPSITLEGQNPVPTVGNGLALWNGKVVFVNPLGLICFFDAKTLNFEKAINPNPEAFIECFETTFPENHLMSDCRGNILKGDLNTGLFSKLIKIDHGNVHKIVYDPSHQRFLCTTDGHFGFAMFDMDGNVLHREEMTNDDVEWIAFNSDYSKLYVSCFDHHLYVYDNTNNKPNLLAKIGFKFQLRQVVCVDEDHVYVCLESGEVYRVNKNFEIVNEAPVGTECIWTIDPHPTNPLKIYCAMEDGGTAIVQAEKQYNTIGMSVLSRHANFGYGRIRRSLPISTGGYVAITTSGMVLKVSDSGDTIWKTQLKGICRDVTFNSTEMKAWVATESGVLAEISMTEGKVLQSVELDGPAWCVAYHPNGNLYLGTRSKAFGAEDGTSEGLSGRLLALNSNTLRITAELSVYGNSKRIKILENGNLLINGNGKINVTEFDPNDFSVIKKYSDWQLNTCENSLAHANQIYAVTYGYQLNTFIKDTGELIDSQFTPDDYPKALHAFTVDDQSMLFVGGRLPFLSLYEIKNGVPDLNRTIYL